MKYKGILLDFYGTLVEEDDDVIQSICSKLAESSEIKATEKDIGHYWWKQFTDLCSQSQLHFYKKQCELEYISLTETAKKFNINLNIHALTGELIQYWNNPKPFPETAEFLSRLNVPSVIVSNIDNVNIEQALRFTHHPFCGIITSEAVRSYKPKAEIFEAALQKIGLHRNEVIHVGDSISLDIAGANAAGIDVIWLNRKQKLAPHGLQMVGNCQSLIDVLDYLN